MPQRWKKFWARLCPGTHCWMCELQSALASCQDTVPVTLTRLLPATGVAARARARRSRLLSI